MDPKCVNEHLMQKGQKFCGECGGAPAVADTAACGCGAAMLKSAKFCSECGTAATEAGLDLDAALGEVDSFIKSAALLDSELHLGAVPEIDPSIVDDARVAEIIRAASVVDRESGESLGVDALPVVTEFLKGQALQAAQSQAYQESTAATLAHVVRSTGAMLKSISAIGRTVASMRDKVEELSGAPRVRRQITPAAGAKPAGAKGGDLTPEDLMVKSLMASGKNPGALSTMEISTLESYTNAGIGLAGLRQADPALAARVEHAIASTTN